MKKKIIIVGSSITAQILYSYITDDNRYFVECFCVNDKYIKENSLFGKKVVALEKLLDYYSPNNFEVLVAMGYNNLNQDRENVFNAIKNFGFTVLTYIHKDAKVYNKNDIGEGSLILANSVIEPFSSIGKNSFIWSNCTIGHHSTLENNCWIASGSTIAGEAKIGSNTFVGVGVTVVNQVKVEKMNIIGAHVLISSNTKENEVFLARAGEKHRFPALDYAKYFMK
jgi:sugar O-acyltransferase (sialic acid O-acetyltransferase NeuD family)